MQTNLVNYRLLFIFLILLSCKEKNEFTLSGEISGNIPKYIYLTYGNTKDSSLVENRKFFFKGKVKNSISAHFDVPPISTVDIFYLENKKIDLNVTVENKEYKNLHINFIKIDSIKGTDTAILKQKFKVFKNTHKNDLDWNIKLNDRLSNIIDEYPNHQYSIDLLNEISKDSVLDRNQLEILYKKLDTLNLPIGSIESLKKILYPETNIKLGGNIYDFKLPNTLGKIIDTKKYRGSMLFIDFWASWCKPCRNQNPKLLTIYEKFKSKNFEILGVSIDTKKENWLEAIENDSLVWENVIDNKGIDSKLLTKYNASTSVPRNFLINEHGRIIKIDISLEELEKLLQEK